MRPVLSSCSGRTGLSPAWPGANETARMLQVAVSFAGGQRIPWPEVPRFGADDPARRARMDR
jgi:hypothetical protein